METFEKPTFYMPWVARRNPHLPTARVHAKAWAMQLGILAGGAHGSGSAIWSEEQFDAIDFALFCAYVHPDAPERVLHLLTDWYVWLFFLDDLFLERFVRTHETSGALDFLERLATFMPLEPADIPADRANAAERGLADLWSRTAPGASSHWRTRFIANNRSLHEEFLWEVSDHSRERVVNPIEYVGLRRRTGGTPWSADLVEYALPGELPAGVMRTPPLQVLRDCFADTVGLRNDIVSYRKEVAAGEINNGVMVVRRFLACDLQQAVDAVDALLTARLRHFEHTALTRLAPLFEERGLDLSQRAVVLAYVRGLEDWMAGDNHWAQSSRRYADDPPHGGGFVAPAAPRGLGGAAARIRRPPARPRAPAGPDEAPEPYMPFSTRPNPALASVRASGGAWARAMGLVDGRVWDQARLDAIDVGLLSALTHPDAPGAVLELVNRWNIWAFYLDDLIVEAFKRGRPLGAHDLVLARAMSRRLALFVPIEPSSEPAPAPATACERGLQDLWARTATHMDDEMCRRLASILRDLFDHATWELENLAQRRVPEGIEYVQMRRRTIAAEFSIGLERFCTPGGRLLPDVLAGTRPVRELVECHADWQGLYNDLVSAARERVHDRDPHTAPRVVARLLGCDDARAAHVVNDLATVRVRQFEDIVEHELEPLFDALELDADVCADAWAFVLELQHWMAGAHVWSTRTERYAERDRGGAWLRPAGLGTAAVRVGPHVR